MKKRYLFLGVVAVGAVGGSLLALEALGWFHPRDPISAPEAAVLRAERGAPDYVPGFLPIEFTRSGVFENTLPAMERSIARGMQVLALDVRLSRDRVPVVIHDAVLDRVSDGEGPVAVRTYLELRALDLGFGARIPSLEEVFGTFGSAVRYVLTFPDDPQGEECALLVVDMVQHYRVQATLASRSGALLREVEDLAQEIETEWIAPEGRAPWFRRPSTYRYWLNLYRADGIRLPISLAFRPRVEEFNRAGFRVSTGAVNDRETLDRVTAAGVHAASSWFTSLADIPPAVPPHQPVDENTLIGEAMVAKERAEATRRAVAAGKAGAEAGAGDPEEPAVEPGAASAPKPAAGVSEGSGGRVPAP